MYRLLAASFGIIARDIPHRSFLKKTSFAHTFALFAITVLLTLVADLLVPLPGDEIGFEKFTAGMSILISLASTALIVFAVAMVLNRHAKEKFSLKEVFVLEVLLTTGVSIIANIVSLPAVFLGPDVFTMIGIVTLIFGIYMLLTYQIAISKIAAISKSNAAIVIVAPFAVVLVFWILMLVFAQGVAATM